MQSYCLLKSPDPISLTEQYNTLSWLPLTLMPWYSPVEMISSSHHFCVFTSRSGNRSLRAAAARTGSQTFDPNWCMGSGACGGGTATAFRGRGRELLLAGSACLPTNLPARTPSTGCRLTQASKATLLIFSYPSFRLSGLVSQTLIFGAEDVNSMLVLCWSEGRGRNTNHQISPFTRFTMLGGRVNSNINLSDTKS